MERVNFLTYKEINMKKREYNTRSDDQWREFFRLVDAKKSEGFSVGAVCDEQGVSRRHYNYHRRRIEGLRMGRVSLRRPSKKTSFPAKDFVKYVPHGEESSNGYIEIIHGALKLRVPGHDEEALKNALKVVRAL